MENIGGILAEAKASQFDRRDDERVLFFKSTLRSRPPIDAHVIVFANEKGGVGKTTAAFHTAVALADAGASVFAIDLDPRQQSLARALENREGTARRLRITLPSPRYVVLQNQSDAGLRHEIARLGNGCHYIIIDVAGRDSLVARHAITLADTLVTPVNPSFVDLDVLGQVDLMSSRIKSLGCFTRLVHDLTAQRAQCGKLSLDWVVMQNRVRRSGARNEQRVEDALKKISTKAGFRIGSGLTERVVYRELFPFGLTLFDLKWLPDMGRAQPVARRELNDMMVGLKLPEMAKQQSLLA